jgi:hypothetical protein
MLWGFCGRVEGVWVIDFIDGLFDGLSCGLYFAWGAGLGYGLGGLYWNWAALFVFVYDL